MSRTKGLLPPASTHLTKTSGCTLRVRSLSVGDTINASSRNWTLGSFSHSEADQILFICTWTSPFHIRHMPAKDGGHDVACGPSILLMVTHGRLCLTDMLTLPTLTSQCCKRPEFSRNNRKLRMRQPTKKGGLRFTTTRGKPLLTKHLGVYQ